MAVPGFQDVMYPLLRLIGDGKEHNFRDVVETLATEFRLSDEDRKELLQSGQQVFDNRVGWARTYMKKAGLLSAPGRAVIQITDRGKEVLRKQPKEVNVKFLNQYPEFKAFHTQKKDESEKVNENTKEETPEEQLEESYQQIRKSLAQELLNKVMGLPPAFFEKLVVELIVRMGYGGSLKDAGKAIGRTGDEGIDGVIKEDKLGLDIIYIQAKRWKPDSVVGRSEIQKICWCTCWPGC